MLNPPFYLILRRSVFYVSTLVIVTSASCAHKKLQHSSAQHYPINNSAVDSAMYKSILPYKTSMNAQMGGLIGKSAQALAKEQPEGLLGNFVADCIFAQSKKYLGKDSVLIDAVVLNHGGLRAPLPQGEITIGNIYELMPFDNELVLLELSPDKTMQMLNFIAEKGGTPVSGIRMKIENKKAVAIKIKGKEPETNHNYFIITSDYLVNGGDKADFFKNPVSIKPLKILVRDAIITYCQSETAKGNLLNAQLDGRISGTK